MIKLFKRFGRTATASYHPLPGSHRLMQRPAEAFALRWQFLSHALKAHGARNFCDLGCAEGYYVRRVAVEHKIFALGLDQSRKRIEAAVRAAAKEGAHSAAFACVSLTTAEVNALPRFDAVACMSLLHHIIHGSGFELARDLLVSVANITGKVMLFDMGGPDEIENQWAKSLTMFKGDTNRKIIELLTSCGFSNVTIVGNSPGYQSTANRSFFVCTSRAD